VRDVLSLTSKNTAKRSTTFGLGEGKIYSRPRCFPWNIRSFFFPLEPIQGYVNMDISSELYLDQIRKLQCVQCCFLAIWIASALPQNLQFLQTFRDFTKDSGANFLSMSWNLDALAWGIIQKKTKIMDYLTSNFPLAHVDRANRHRRPQDGTKTGLANYPCVDLPICIHMSHTKSCTSYCPP
jgi:hypothetical protein